MKWVDRRFLENEIPTILVEEAASAHIFSPKSDDGETQFTTRQWVERRVAIPDASIPTPCAQSTMNSRPATCPNCGSSEVHFRKSRGDWTCLDCKHDWQPGENPSADSEPAPGPRVKLFLSYGPGDAAELADRLEQDLSLSGYEVWRDSRNIRPGKAWEAEIVDGLRSTEVVVALLSPRAVRRSGDPNSTNDYDSICLDELSFARFVCKTPIVPVMAIPCEPPFVIFRLDYVKLLQWRDFGEAYQRGFQGLREAIEVARTSTDKVWRYRRWDDRLQPFEFADYLFTNRRDFCGREWLFQEIEQWRAEAGRQRALLIIGDPGIGKSAIVAQLIHDNPGGQVLAHHCCQFRSRETLRPGRFIRSMAAQIASQLEGYAAQLENPTVEAALGEGRCQEDPFSAFEEGILGPLHALQAPPGGARYILIDALDEALAVQEGPSLVALLAARLDRLPGWLRVVATARKDPDVLRQLSGLRAQEIQADDPRNLDDIEEFLVHRLGQPDLQERLVQSGLPAEESILRLRDKSGGNFLWVEQALLGLESGTYHFARLEALPPGLTGLYTAFFERHFPGEAAYAPARQVLEVIVAATEPLSAAEIAAATGLDPDYALPPLLDRLAAYIPERDGRRAVFHKSFADWLTATESPRPAGRFFASPRRGHERLASWCWAEYQRGPARMAPYSLRHLPAHLGESVRWDDLANLVRDLPYLESRAEAGQVFELALDFTRAVERIPNDHPARRHLRLIEQALRFDLHFLARHPSTLFQCLWNRCWWYDCPEAANHYDALAGGWPPGGPPWARPEAERLATLLESWRSARERQSPGSTWVRSLRPPELALGSPQLACLRGHENRVTSVAYSPDGRRVVSGSRDRTGRVWDAKSGAELACLRGHKERVESVAYSPDGRRIVSGSDDKTVRVWDAQNGAELACVRGHEGGVTSVAYSPDGRRIVSGSSDRIVRVWDAQSCAELACLRGHEGVVESVAYSPDGRRIVSGARTVRVWDAQSGAELACLRGHEKWVRSVAYSPDGRRIVSGSEDDTVRVWEAQGGAELACIRGHAMSVMCVAHSPDGRRIVSGSYDQTVRVWDAQSGAELACLRGHKKWVISVAYSPDGRRIISRAFMDKMVRVWNARSGKCLKVIRGFADVAAIAARSEAFPWRAVDRGLEIVIEPASGGDPIAWFPAALEHITTSPSGRRWAGSVGNHVYLIELEGKPKDR